MQSLPDPSLVAPTLLYWLAAILERLDLAQLFPKPQPLEVELGSGDGSFLVHYARLHPERSCIGVERLLGRLRKLDRKGRRAGLTHLRDIRLRFTGVPGRSTNTERAPAVTGPWTTINTQTAPLNGLIEYVDTNAPAGSAFYRTSTPQGRACVAF